MTAERLNPDWQAKSSDTLLSGKLEYHRIGNVVQVNFLGYQPGTLTARTQVATMPAGFRPASYAYFTIATSDAWSTNAGYIGSSGAIMLETTASGKTLWGHVVYPVWG